MTATEGMPRSNRMGAPVLVVAVIVNEARGEEVNTATMILVALGEAMNGASQALMVILAVDEIGDPFMVLFQGLFTLMFGRVFQTFVAIITKGCPPDAVAATRKVPFSESMNCKSIVKNL